MHGAGNVGKAGFPWPHWVQLHSLAMPIPLMTGSRSPDRGRNWSGAATLATPPRTASPVPGAGHHLKVPAYTWLSGFGRNTWLVARTGSRSWACTSGRSDPLRRWPREAFATVIDALATLIDCRFVLTGSAASAGYPNQISRSAAPIAQSAWQARRPYREAPKPARQNRTLLRRARPTPVTASRVLPSSFG